MENEDLILAEDFCTHYQVSHAFITDLAYAGLLELTIVEERHFIRTDQLREVEKLVRLHAELGINEEGVEAIAYLLQRMNGLQKELRMLQQKLHIYEGGRK